MVFHLVYWSQTAVPLGSMPSHSRSRCVWMVRRPEVLEKQRNWNQPDWLNNQFTSRHHFSSLSSTRLLYYFLKWPHVSLLKQNINSYQVLCSGTVVGRSASSSRCWGGWLQRGSPWVWGSGRQWCTWQRPALSLERSMGRRYIWQGNL